MKKLLCLTALLLAAMCLFASCKKEEKHEHKFTEWSVTKNPTCTEDGVKSRYCECGEKQTDAVPAKGHTFIDGVCTECDFNKNTECKHNSLEILQGFAASCTETGLTEGKKCTTCMNIIVEQEIIPALDHNKRTYTEKDENCNVYNVTVCDRNGCDFTDRVATGVVSHAFGEWERVNNVTGSPCGVDKIYKRTCAVCSANEEKVEPTADHNYKATIISTHSFNSATYEASIGEIKYTCQNANCDSVYYEYEKHEYAQTIVNSTCAEQGYTLYSCACGHSYKSNFTDKLPHIPGAEATCTTAQICTQCYEIITPALGHDWKDATCTDPKTCQRCAVTDGEESGHSYQNNICDVCGFEWLSGLYDEEGNLIVSWNELENVYGIDIEKNYKSYSGITRDIFSNSEILLSGKRLVIDRSVTNIGNWALAGCNSLTEIIIPDTVTRIGNSAFRQCESITKVEIPNSVNIIETYAFSGCRMLTKIAIPEGVENISGVFSNCTSLTEVVLPSSLIIIDGAFASCSSLTKIIIPQNVVSVGDYTFNECSSLQELIIPEGVKTIGEYTFYNCDSLTSLTIPYGVEKIGDKAFYHCDSLISLILPDSIIYVGDDAFECCSNLKLTKSNNGLYFGTEDNPYFILVSILDISVNSFEIHQNTKIIAENALYGCSNISFIIVPNEVISICDYAFQECASLTSVVIPNSITNIGSFAFLNCKKLTYNEFNNCKYLGNTSNPYVALIEANKDIRQCDINPNTKIIAGRAFFECDFLRSITIPDSVISIGDYAFYKSYIESVVLPKNITSIGEYAFSSTNLVSVIIPDGVTYIDDFAFDSCPYLTSVVIPSSVRTIGYSVFSNSKLNDIYFTGSKNEWDSIVKYSGDYINATVHYNYVQ